MSSVKKLTFLRGSSLCFFFHPAIALCTVASLFFFFCFISPHNFRCFHCHETLQNSVHRKFTANNLSGTAKEKTITNISHILFGIAGSAKTWSKRQRYCELWWKPNTTRGFVWLDEAPNTTWPVTSPPYKVSEDTTRFNYTCWYGTRSAIRLTRIVKESFELGMENVRWFVMGDDDTVFFIENLVKVLGKYDHEEMYYIGDSSESVEQDVIHSYAVAYGGGGYAISYALAVELVKILDGCIDRYASLYGGDQKVQACLSEIGIPLSKELGFHQADIRGNPYGMLAAHPLAPLVSLHHVDYLQPIFPTMNQADSLMTLMSAYNSDPSRTLQQTICYDSGRNWSVSVSWGYTVQLYPSLVTAKEMEKALQTFQTWKSWSDGPFTFNTRGVGPDPCRLPLLFFLERVENVGMGQNQTTLTTYKRYMDVWEKGCSRDDYASAMNIEFFSVSASKFNPELWNKAPRRQCCEVDGTNEIKKSIQVNIRGCNHFETVTLP